MAVARNHSHNSRVIGMSAVEHAGTAGPTGERRYETGAKRAARGPQRHAGPRRDVGAAAKRDATS